MVILKSKKKMVRCGTYFELQDKHFTLYDIFISMWGRGVLNIFRRYKITLLIGHNTDAQ